MNLYEMYLYCMLSLYSDYVSERITWNNDGHVEYEILGAAVLDSNFEMLSFLQFLMRNQFSVNIMCSLQDEQCEVHAASAC